MFEALRGLRDAVAPESGNLGGGANNNNNNNNSNEGNNNNNNTNTEPDVEELWSLYRTGDRDVTDMIKRYVYVLFLVNRKRRRTKNELCDERVGILRKHQTKQK